MTNLIAQHHIVCFGEILWDILPTGAKPGGAPMNVAYHLKKLGCNPAMITRVGSDDYGKDLVKLLSEQNISTDYFQVDAIHNTGVVYAKPDKHNEMTYDIVYPAAWDFIEWNDRDESLLQQADYFVHGSLSARNDVSKNTLFRLREMAKKKVLDINLRTPYFNQTIVEQLLAGVDILKLNEAELELIGSWYTASKNAIGKMNALQDQFKIPTIIVTKGGEGAVLNINGAIHQHVGYQVQVADTVGSGDSFLAGFLAKLIEGVQPYQALDFACGLGALIASRTGACPEYKLTEVKELMQTPIGPGPLQLPH